MSVGVARKPLERWERRARCAAAAKIRGLPLAACLRVQLPNHVARARSRTALHCASPQTCVAAAAAGVRCTERRTWAVQARRARRVPHVSRAAQAFVRVPNGVPGRSVGALPACLTALQSAETDMSVRQMRGGVGSAGVAAVAPGRWRGHRAPHLVCFVVTPKTPPIAFSARGK